VVKTPGDCLLGPGEFGKLVQRLILLIDLPAAKEREGPAHSEVCDFRAWAGSVTPAHLERR
jgi:hypothetical protein